MAAVRLSANYGGAARSVNAIATDRELSPLGLAQPVTFVVLAHGTVGLRHAPAYGRKGLGNVRKPVGRLKCPLLDCGNGDAGLSGSPANGHRNWDRIARYDSKWDDYVQLQNAFHKAGCCTGILHDRGLPADCYLYRQHRRGKRDRCRLAIHTGG